MNPILKNVLAVLLGIIVGSIVNMSIVMVSGSIIPPPEGSDVTTAEGLKASMHLFKPIHFLMPFLAHALGTLIGALTTAFIAASQKIKLAMIIGTFFLIGGIASIFMLPSPAWFSLTDLALAYLPMAYMGGKLGVKIGL